MTKFFIKLSMFIASFVIGYNMLNLPEKAQAMPPVPSVLEMPQIFQQTAAKANPEIDLFIDLNTDEVSVQGNANASVTITHPQKETEKIKYKTIKTRDTIYVSTVPKVNLNRITPLPEPLSPFTYETE